VLQGRPHLAGLDRERRDDGQVGAVEERRPPLTDDGLGRGLVAARVGSGEADGDGLGGGGAAQNGVEVRDQAPRDREWVARDLEGFSEGGVVHVLSPSARLSRYR